MFASTVLNYMDRQAMALVGPKIKGEFRTRQRGFRLGPGGLPLTYAFFQVPAGYLADRWDVRWTYAGAVAWWSLAGIAAAFAPTPGRADGLPGAARGGGVVQLALRPAGDGDGPAAGGSGPGQRDLQLGGGGRGGPDAAGRAAADASGSAGGRRS